MKKEHETLSEKIEYWKKFLLDSNEKIHTDNKGILMAESLTMNNFIIDWFDDLAKDVKEHTQNAQRRLKEELGMSFVIKGSEKDLNKLIDKIFLEEFGRKLTK